MSDKEFAAQFVNGLVEKTVAGRLLWGENTGETVMTELPNKYLIFLAEEQDGQGNPWYLLSVFNPSGERILRVSSRFEVVEGVTFLSDLSLLWEVVRAQVPRQSDVERKSLLESLSKL